MKRPAFFCFVLLLLIAPLGHEALSQPASKAQVAQSDTLDVLFVGNSYIYFNNLPALVEGIALSVGGPAIRADLHTHGGYMLEEHLADGHLLKMLDGARTADPENSRPETASWDIAIFQEQSTLGARISESSTGQLGSPAAFFGATTDLVAMFSERAVHSMLYMTWAKEQFPHQTDELAAAYDSIGIKLNVPVAPVGIAWARVQKERANISLYSRDGSHPSPEGSYLAACVFYSQLTGLSSEGASSTISGAPWNMGGVSEGQAEAVLVELPSETARYLQRVAYEVVKARAPSEAARVR